MLFFPFGAFSGDAADPARLAEEFREAARQASDTTWWQFLMGAISSPGRVDWDSIAAIVSAGDAVLTGINHTTGPTLYDWKVPYNQGLQPIPATSVDWTATHPELLLVIFSFQFYRDTSHTAHLNTGSSRLRVQVRAEVDGVEVHGGGPMSHPIDGRLRGGGYSDQALATCIVGLTLVQPGTHSVRAVAGQLALTSGDENGEDEITTLDHPPTDVAIGSRNMIVMRFARATMMEG
jgi:hypothetical protein